MNRLSISIFTIAITLLSTGSPAQQQEPIADLEQRLESLSPDNPSDYFELAEELAEEADEIEEVRLSQRLYVLAFELDRRATTPTIAAGACLGLADLARYDHERDWVLALAAIVDPRYAALDRQTQAAARADAEARANAAQVLGLIRAGYGVRARRLLEDPAVSSLLERRDRRLSRWGVPGELNNLRRQASQWPCPECNNDRVTRLRAGTSREPAICPVCRGNPGPPMNTEQLQRHLGLEAELLGVSGRSWGSQLLAGAAAPLRDPDPDLLASVYRVDPTRTIYRDGSWVTP